MVFKRSRQFYMYLGFLMVLTLLVATKPTDAASSVETQIQAGITWLQTHQGADGSWGISDTAFRDTTSVLVALQQLSQQVGVFDMGLQWVRTHQVNSVDYISRKIELFNPTGDSVSGGVTLLLSYQNRDGGWGLAPGFESDSLDTALVLQALADVAGVDSAILNNSTDYLLAAQNSDGSWGLVTGESGSILTTTLAMRALQNQPPTAAIIAALSRAVAFLLTHQNPDGGFGSPLSIVWETALSHQALVRSILDPISRSLAISYLSSTQLPDGSWDEDPYSTALALRALSDSGIISSAQINPINLTKVIDGISQPASTYSAYETMTIGVTTADPNTLLEITVQDSTGTVYTTRTEGGLIFFDTSNLPSGTYTLVVRAIDPDTGIIIDERTTTFTIASTIAITNPTLVVIPRYTHVGATETETITLSFANRSNTNASLTIQHEVKTPSGTAINSGITSISLSPDTTSTTVTLSTFSHTFTESGDYPIQAKVLNGAVPLTTADSSISAAPLVRIDPTKTLSPTTVTPDGDKRIRINIHLEGVEQKP